jgi:hypothetical protein
MLTTRRLARRAEEGHHHGDRLRQRAGILRGTRLQGWRMKNRLFEVLRLFSIFYYLKKAHPAVSSTAAIV